MIAGDLCYKGGELVVFYNYDGHYYRYCRSSQDTPFCGCLESLPRAPIKVGSWVRRESLEVQSVLLRVTKFVDSRFEFDWIYDKTSSNKFRKVKRNSKLISSWVPVEPPPEAKNLEPRFLPNDLAVTIDPSLLVTVLEVYEKGYLVDNGKKQFKAFTLNRKKLEAGDWVRFEPRNGTSLLRRVNAIFNGRFSSNRLKHAGGFQNEYSRGHNVENWVAVKSPEANRLEAKSQCTHPSGCEHCDWLIFIHQL